MSAPTNERPQLLMDCSRILAYLQPSPATGCQHNPAEDADGVVQEENDGAGVAGVEW